MSEIKTLLAKTTDKDIKANLERMMDQSKKAYTALVKFVYENAPTKIEDGVYKLNSALETTKEVLKTAADLSPVGDAKVLVTGTDFHHRKQNRLMAAGFLVLDMFGGEVIGMQGRPEKTH